MKDARYENTHRRILKGFETLLVQKDFLSITVKELCHTAGVDRKTFYRHFSGLDAVLQETQKNVETEYIRQTAHLKRPDDINEITRVFINMREGLGPFGERLTYSADNFYISGQIDRSTMAKTWEPDGQPCRQELVKAFVSGATLAMYRQWVRDGRQMEKEEFIELAVSLLTKGTDSLKQN